jgi:hypothetical protein
MCSLSSNKTAWLYCVPETDEGNKHEKEEKGKEIGWEKLS